MKLIWKNTQKMKLLKKELMNMKFYLTMITILTNTISKKDSLEDLKMTNLHYSKRKLSNSSIDLLMTLHKTMKEETIE
jgi:hypothetical protein